MRKKSEMTLIRIFLEESKKFRGKPAYSQVLDYLRAEGYAGATVLRGVEGYGRHRRMHKAGILELSTNLPVVVEIVESNENAAKLMEALDRLALVNEALVTEERITVYRFNE